MTPIMLQNITGLTAEDAQSSCVLCAKPISETGSRVSSADFELNMQLRWPKLLILLHPSPQWWEYRHAPPCPASESIFKRKKTYMWYGAVLLEYLRGASSELRANTHRICCIYSCASSRIFIVADTRVSIHICLWRPKINLGSCSSGAFHFGFDGIVVSFCFETMSVV